MLKSRVSSVVQPNREQGGSKVMKSQLKNPHYVIKRMYCIICERLSIVQGDGYPVCCVRSEQAIEALEHEYRRSLYKRRLEK